MSNLFTSWKPDPAGLILSTGFMRFTTALGVNGLALKSDEELQLLAVDSSEPGTGQFRRFIEACKVEFKRVLIMHVWNPWLSAALERYGFKPHKEWASGEEIECMKWEKGDRY